MIDLTGKTAKEKAKIKGIEIAKIGSVRKTKRKDFSIKIISMKAIEGGVEIFARAWDDNGQIGFGKDGTVDIERFISINPPILVDDPSGTIIRTWIDDETGETKTRKLREDLKEALLQNLEHTIEVSTQKHDNSKIIPGKIGNTHTDYHPAEGQNSPVDGIVSTGSQDTTWTTLRDQTSGTGFPSVNPGAVQLESRVASWRIIARGMVLFDTSNLGTDTIDSATYSIFGTNKADGLGITGTSKSDFHIVSASPANDDDLVAGDLAKANFGTTSFGLKTYAAYSASAYNNITLNASGKTHIDGSGLSRFGERMGADLDDDEPGFNGGANTRMDHNFAEESGAGTTNDPKLVIEHTIATINNTLTAAVGVFTLTGIAVILGVGRTMAAAVGSFILTGLGAGLFFSQWTNKAKNSTSYSNKSKSSSSWTNKTTNSSTWTNKTRN